MTEITDKLIKVVATTEEKVNDLSQAPVSDGSIYFTGDTNNLFYDYDNKRKKVSDIVTVKTNEEQQAMENNPVASKFYYVEGSKELYFRGSENEWHTVFPAQVDFDFGEY